MQPFGFLLLLLISLIHGGECNIQQCSIGWTFSIGRCVQYGDIPKTWHMAQFTCLVNGGKLAEPETVGESHSFTGLAYENSDDCVWLGGSDDLAEGDWEWYNPRRSVSGYTGWHLGQPDNYNNEDCLSLLKRYDYEWNDQSCYEICNYICTRPVYSHLSS